MILATLILLAGVEEPAVVLRGRIEAATPGPSIIGGPDEVVIGTDTRIRVRVRKVEAGSWSGGRTFDTVVRMASLPHAEFTRRVFLVVEREGTGWKAINWGTVDTGVCISADYAAAHGLSDDLPRLRKRKVVVCD